MTAGPGEYGSLLPKACAYTGRISPVPSVQARGFFYSGRIQMKSARHKSGLNSMSGVTLLETTAAIAILVIIAFAMMACFSRAAGSDVASAENIKARAAVTRVMDGIRNYASSSFETTYACFNSEPSDDPDGYGTAPGNSYVIDGLYTANGPAHVRIEFPEENGHLRENIDAPELGMPKDLDGDGEIGTDSVDGTYKILPVRVVVQWESINGTREYSVVTFVISKKVLR